VSCDRAFMLTDAFRGNGWPEWEEISDA